jgi:hypothetical protein
MAWARLPRYPDRLLQDLLPRIQRGQLHEGRNRDALLPKARRPMSGRPCAGRIGRAVRQRRAASCGR